jgi:hypothetical protein
VYYTPSRMEGIRTAGATRISRMSQNSGKLPHVRMALLL